MKAVIQAGGMGTRLRPFTTILPKPLMPVDEMPVIEILLKWLRRSGIKDIYITIGYLGHLIRALCGDGSQWDMKITYSEEHEPLGTVGPLALLGPEVLDEPFVMLNGDVVTDLNLRDLSKAHLAGGADVTIAVTRKTVKVDLGVIECDGDTMVNFREKPEMSYLVSMGIYCMSPSVLDIIPKGVPFGFDDLMYSMLESERPVKVMEHSGIWMDIGQLADYEKAQDILLHDKAKILGT